MQRTNPYYYIVLVVPFMEQYASGNAQCINVKFDHIDTAMGKMAFRHSQSDVFLNVLVVVTFSSSPTTL